MSAFGRYFRAGGLASVLGGLLTFPATAEIVFLDNGQVASVDSAYVYAHPSMRSVVFASPQARAMAILPPVPYFINSPPLLLRAPAPYASYPPVVYQSGINAPLRPSNRDVATYNIERAHSFSQESYYPENSLRLFALPYGVMPYYPPVSGSGGFNQPIRPSNRDNASYSIERAHRFSMDTYKKP